VQNRHFVRPQSGGSLCLQVNDEVVALTLPTWHQAGPVFPTRNECQRALRTWGRGKHQSGQSPSYFRLARNSSTCPSPSSATRSLLIHDELSRFYMPPPASLILKDESIYQATAQKSTQRLLELLNKGLVIERKVSCLRRTTIPANQG